MIEIKNRWTGEVIHSGEFGTTLGCLLDAIEKDANLRYANLEGAKLMGAKLMGVNLMGANLRYANLEDANLRYANLRYANLEGAKLMGAKLMGVNLMGANLRNANLEDANLRYANLRNANVWGCPGDRNHIKSLFISEVYPITYTAEVMQIGCECHPLSEWWSFDDEIIIQMDCKKALKFWRENKEFIQMAIEKYPATPTKKIEESEKAA